MEKGSDSRSYKCLNLECYGDESSVRELWCGNNTDLLNRSESVHNLN